MPYQRAAQAILADWRAVEAEMELVRSLTDAPPLQAELRLLHAEARALRDEYQRLIEEALAGGRPDLPPFPESQRPPVGPR
jgi:hypothetical protein